MYTLSGLRAHLVIVFDKTEIYVKTVKNHCPKISLYEIIETQRT